MPHEDGKEVEGRSDSCDEFSESQLPDDDGRCGDGQTTQSSFRSHHGQDAGEARASADQETLRQANARVQADHNNARNLSSAAFSSAWVARRGRSALRHLLSYRYDRALDKFQKIVVWTNPSNSQDTLFAPELASRKPRELERALDFNECGASSSDDGIFCGIADFEVQAATHVAHYWHALDERVKSGEAPLMLVLTGDATGGWRGDAVTHDELGIGSWAKGKSQSRLTLLPLFLMEGDDSASNLRSRATPVADCYNRLKKKGTLSVEVHGDTRTLAIDLVVAADFQFFKAAMNMSKYTSAVWCTCSLDNLYKRPDTPANTWADCERFYSEISCELKDLRTICELNHYSLELLQGQRFKPFTCRCGWQSGSEKEWRRTVEEHLQLEGDELKAADLAHSSMREHCRHKPYAPPLFHQGTEDNSADILHLVFINMFAFFFEMTILVHIFEMSPMAREPFELYCRSISVPIKATKATSIADMKQALTGRDAKVLVSNAITHIPMLLEYAHAGDEAEAAAADESGTGPRGTTGADDDFDWEGDEEADEVHGDSDAESRLLRDALSWDKFIALALACRPLDEDTRANREVRAVEAFNAASGVMAEYKRLSPESQSACPHVALCVVPRQWVAKGDPGRRGTDMSESYGAAIKDSIHRRCLRRRKGTTSVMHRKRDAAGNVLKTWTQRPLGVSRIMQVFRDCAVRERLLRDDESMPYLLRKHFKLAQTGFSTGGDAAAAGQRDGISSIYERMAEGRDFS